MAELWSLRITVKGATKTFSNVNPDDAVAALADRAAQDFRCKGGLDLAGGFPPKALDAAAKLSDVTTNNAALREWLVPRCPGLDGSRAELEEAVAGGGLAVRAALPHCQRPSLEAAVALAARQHPEVVVAEERAGASEAGAEEEGQRVPGALVQVAIHVHERGGAHASGGDGRGVGESILREGLVEVALDPAHSTLCFAEDVPLHQSPRVCGVLVRVAGHWLLSMILCHEESRAVKRREKKGKFFKIKC